MRLTKWMWFLIFLIGSGMGLVAHQPATIEISGADVTQYNTLSMAGGNGTANLGLAPRIQFEGINLRQPYPLGPEPSFTLTTSPRIVFYEVNARQEYALSNLPDLLQSYLTRVDPRFYVQYLQQAKQERLVYPHDLLNDSTPPIIERVSPISLEPTQTILEIITNEPTQLIFNYGSQAGDYPNQIEVTSFSRNHHLTLVNTTLGQRFYYQLTATDQSNNLTQTEGTFTNQVSTYLPLLLK